MTNRLNEPYEVTLVDRAVGLAVLVAVLLVVGAIVLRYQEIGPGEKTLHFHSNLKRSYGIVRGSDIRLSGIAIGKIEDIALERSGKVRVDLGFSDTYRAFITRGSHLEIGSAIGIAAVLGGTGLTFVSNDESDELLPEGAAIETLQPVDLGEVFSDKELRDVAENIKTLIANLREVSAAVQGNQAVIGSSIRNVDEITREIRQTTRQLPKMLATVESGFETWKRAGARVYQVVDESGDDIREIARHTRESSVRLERTLAEMEELARQAGRIVARIHDGAEELPALISDGHALIRSTSEITERLNRHWLFGGGAESGAVPSVMGRHPSDPSLYGPPQPLGPAGTSTPSIPADNH